MIWGLRGASWGQLRRGNPTRMHNAHCVHFGMLFRVSFVPKPDSKAFLFVFICMRIFCIAFGRPLASIWKDLGSTWGAFSIIFWRCCKTVKNNTPEAKYLIWGVLGRHFYILFANRLIFVCVAVNIAFFCNV